MLPKVIKLELPTMMEYLDSRLFTNDITDSVSTSSIFNPITGRDYDIKKSLPWPDIERFRAKFDHSNKEELEIEIIKHKKCSKLRLCCRKIRKCHFYESRD